jgi:6-phosphogluconolactonase
MSEPRILVVDDPAATVAAILADAARRSAQVALTGGHTPARAYELAAEFEPDWSGAGVWWGDERCVPPDDERSNFRLGKEHLLDRLARPPAVHRILGELPPPEAADAYERELDGVAIDLMLLGLGPDAHAASLFPGTPQLGERSRRVTSGPAGLEPFVDRVTLTVPALLESRRIVFLIEGAGKAEAVERAFRGPIGEHAPASLLREGEAPIDVYLDEAAAGSAE